MILAQRKNKKGLDYIDWSMSLGIFIIAVLALFIFLKPGVKPSYDGDNLLQIVESNFMKETASVVKETPLFVHHLNDLYGASVEALVTVKLNGDWRFEGISPASLQAFKVTLNSNDLTLDCTATGLCDNKNFTLFWSPKRTNPGEPTLSFDCTPSGTPAICNAALGSTTSEEGLDTNFLNTLKTKNYQQLKNDWDYPSTKEFAIFIDNALWIGAEQPQTGSVVAKEIKYWKIQGKSRTPVSISIRVW